MKPKFPVSQFSIASSVLLTVSVLSNGEFCSATMFTGFIIIYVCLYFSLSIQFGIFVDSPTA